MTISCTICKQPKTEVEFSYTQRRRSFNQPKYKPKCLFCMEIRHEWQCEICGGFDQGKQLAVDHDHKTGKTRGRLCSNCNRALGLLKDSIPILERAMKYLRNHK